MFPVFEKKEAVIVKCKSIDLSYSQNNILIKNIPIML